MNKNKWKFEDNELKCPYCGHINEDTDFNDNDVWECENCEKEFDVRAEYEPVYYVRKKGLNE